MEVRIRRGRRTDYEPLAALGTWPGVGGDVRRSIRLFRRVVADLGGDLYVAEENGELVGYVAVSYARVLALGGQRATVEELVVREDRRRRGIGRRLMDLARTRAARRGVKGVRAFPPDEGAARFLEQAGFTAGGECREWKPEAKE